MASPMEIITGQLLANSLGQVPAPPPQARLTTNATPAPSAPAPPVPDVFDRPSVNTPLPYTFEPPPPPPPAETPEPVAATGPDPSVYSQALLLQGLLQGIPGQQPLQTNMATWGEAMAPGVNALMNAFGATSPLSLSQQLSATLDPALAEIPEVANFINAMGGLGTPLTPSGMFTNPGVQNQLYTQLTPLVDPAVAALAQFILMGGGGAGS